MTRVFLTAVVVGLSLTWLLGTVTGFVMGALGERYAGGVRPDSVVPLLGWSLTGGDWRPAHFLAIHAQQIVPLAGFALSGWGERAGLASLIIFCAFYLSATFAALWMAASGLPFAPL